jgi:hypothetical protein
MWSPRRRLSQLSSAELFTRGAEYRRMANTASTSAIKNSLDKLAIRVTELAAARRAFETGEQESEAPNRSSTELSKLIKLAEDAASCAPDPVRTLADAIRATAAGDADPYVLMGVLVEGAVSTLVTRTPAVRQDDTAAALARLLTDRLKECGLLR